MVDMIHIYCNLSLVIALVYPSIVAGAAISRCSWVCWKCVRLCVVEGIGLDCSPDDICTDDVYVWTRLVANILDRDNVRPISADVMSVDLDLDTILFGVVSRLRRACCVFESLPGVYGLLTCGACAVWGIFGDLLVSLCVPKSLCDGLRRRSPSWNRRPADCWSVRLYLLGKDN